ncbi:MAG: 30S ribosomal protein S1 [Endomicrobiales bacterium]|nr:30S ribosomal protein S1 [Endomicrobiales bacterium]
MDEMKECEGQNIKAEESASEEKMTMEELLGPEVKLERGAVMKARVISQTADGVLVDLGIKSEGLIPKADFSSESKFREMAPGTEVQVVVINTRTESGHPEVSWRQIAERESWDRLLLSFNDKTPVEGEIKKQIKGGFIVDAGVDAFLPMSQLDLHFTKNTEKYLGKKLQFLVTEYNRREKNIVLSRRKLLETEKSIKREKTLSSIHEGQIIEGTVKSITGFGAFVDIGGMDGLLHIGDLAWHKVRKVDDVLKTGQKVQVQVLKIDKEKGKISLGIKQMSERPWNKAVDKYPVGSLVKGKVTSVTKFGVFVEVEPSIEGLLHVSELTWDEDKDAVMKSFKPGAEVEAKIYALDPEKEKLSLSLKRLTPNPWEEANKKYPAGTRLKVTITKLVPFGAFAKLGEGVEGLIHVQDMSWTKKIRHPKDVVQPGQEVDAVVVEINPENEKISLSLKHVTEDPFRKYRGGKVVKGVVRRLADFGAFVELEPGVEALVRVSEIAPKRIESPKDALKIGQEIEAKVIKSDPSERKIDISIKKLDHDREKELVKKYSGAKDNPTLGEILIDDSDDE